MENFYVYLYRDVDSTPIYVGKGCGQRAYVHLTRSSNSRLRNIVHKRQTEGHTMSPEFLCQQVSEEFALFVECEFIAKHGRADLGTGTLFNHTNGGEGTVGRKMSEEQRLKMSADRKGKPGRIISQEERQKRSATRKGVPHTEERKQKIREAHIGKKHSASSVEKTRQARLGKKHSEEAKQKMREAKRGKKQSEETIAKRVATRITNAQQK